MKALPIVGLLILVCLFADSGNQLSIVYTPAPPEHPVMNLPVSHRQRNWTRGGEGSCVVASMVSLLRWQNKPAMAEHLKRKYGGGQNYVDWKATLDREGIKYASTKASNEVSFLERAVKTRRGCMVGVMPYSRVKEPMHMVCLVDMTARKVCLMDNNYPNKYIWRDRKDFLTEWERAGSWALTPVYSPASPRVR